jgi:hypothetical protein
MLGARKSSYTESRAKLGEPYQLYTEVINTGKTVQGSKKKVRWLFGFTESDQEYEVVFIMSYVSGKKTVYEDGKEIVTVSNMLNTDFTHGWSSHATQRMYRIEVNLNFSSDAVFIFSIDGVAFMDLPQKPSRSSAARKSSTNNNSRYGDEVYETSATRRISASSTSTAPNSRVQSSNINHSTSQQDFDPFAAKGGQAFDPFADDFGSSVPVPSQQQQKKATATNHGRASITAPSAQTRSVEKKPSAAVLLFDEVPTSAPPSANSFEFFDSDPSDPFAAPAPKKSAAPQPSSTSGFDMFAPAPAQVTAASAFDPFGDNDPPVAPASKKPSAVDVFDPFGSSASNNNGHHASAQEISQDFSGLSFIAAPPSVDTTKSLNGNALKAVPPAAPAPEPKPVEVKDPWQTNLVDLDLTGKTTPMRRSSTAINQGPSLDNLMGHHPAPRSSFVGNTGLSSAASDPFAGPPLQAHHGPPMGGYPQMPRPLSSADAISTLGAVPAPINTTGMHYGMGMGSGSGSNFASPANVRGSMSQQPPVMGMGMSMTPSPVAGGSMMMGQGMGMGAARPGGAMGAGMSGGYGVPQSNVRGSMNIPQPQQPKSSLDSLDWRTG